MSEVIVNAGCLLFFAQDVAAELKKDVLDSTLFTQLAATKKQCRFNATKQWKERHLSAMTQFGWVMNTAETFNQPAPRGAPSNVWTLMNQVLPAFMPAHAIADGQARVREYFEADPGQHGFELFTRQVSAPAQSSTALPACLPLSSNPSTPAANPVVMQLGFVEPTAALYLVTLSFSRRRPLTPGLLFEAMDDCEVVGNLEMTFHGLRLQEVVYAQYREAIDAKLRDRRCSLVDRLVGQGCSEWVNP